MKLNKYIDHTLLKQDAVSSQIESLCNEAKEYDFASVCVNPGFVSLASKCLEGTDVMVCTVVGFPLGANTSAVKAFETKDAIANGAEEIDMVINVSKLIEGDNEYVLNDIKAVVEAAKGVTVKVIIESCLLTKEQIATVSQLIMDAGAQFVKTSTGFSTGGATKEDIELWYPKIKDGGIFSIHDYILYPSYAESQYEKNGKDKLYMNSLFGVNKAVDEFCFKNKISKNLTTNESFATFYCYKINLIDTL